MIRKAQTVLPIDPRWPLTARLLLSAAEDVLGFIAFPNYHWTRIYSTNVLERIVTERVDG